MNKNFDNKKTKTTRSKRALARGLSNLIPTDIETKNLKEQKGLVEIDLEKVRTNPNNPRKKFDKTAIEELAMTIEEHGLLQPIIVEEKKNEEAESYYVVVSGERRLRACRHLKMKTVLAIVKELEEQQSLEISLIENIQREQLDAMEEAVVYQKLLKDFSLTQEQLSAKVGKDRSTIANRVRLLQLPVAVQTAVADGRLSEGQVRPLLSLKNTTLQERMAQEIIKKDLNARQVENLVKQKVVVPQKTKATKPDKEIVILQENLEGFFSTRVRLQHNSKNQSGKISIDYFDLDDLERILNKIDSDLWKL